MFGLDALKNREALTALHRAGIAFAALQQPAVRSPSSAAAPQHLLFLEALAEFSNKLLRQDKRQVLRFLEARIPHGLHWGEEWAPLLSYRSSLLTDAPEERPPPARKHYARRNRTYRTRAPAPSHTPSHTPPLPSSHVLTLSHTVQSLRYTIRVHQY